MTFTQIDYRLDDGVAIITLNRPDAMNAFTKAMADELIEAFDRSDQDDSVKVVVLTGAGSRAFCAGADLNDSSEGGFGNPIKIDSWSDERIRDDGGRVALRIYNSRKFVIGAFNGSAVGVGLTIMLPADIRIASNRAKFGCVFARRGMAPEAASSWFLPRIVGLPVALEWCGTGRLFSAEEALEKGLVHSIHDPESILDAAIEKAREIADNCAPVSLALTRAMLWRLSAADHPMEAHRIDSRVIQFRYGANDANEGVASFLEKRAANFEDKVNQDLPEFFPWWEEPAYS